MELRPSQEHHQFQGFSLIELVIVVAIIGVLASIAIPSFRKFQLKARQTEARASLSAIYTGEKAFHQEWRQYIGDFIEIGYLPEGNFRYEHGFTASNSSPPGYTGMIGPSAVPPVANLSTVANCGTAPTPGDFNGPLVAGGICSVDRNPIGGNIANLANEDSFSQAFVAGAHGNIDSDGITDVWQIDENKAFYGPCTAPASAMCATDGGDIDN